MASRRGPDNSVRVALSGTLSGQNWANVLHCQLSTSSAITQNDLNLWTTAFRNAYATRLLPYCHSDVALTLTKAVLYTPGGGELIGIDTNSTGGSAAGTRVDDNAASLVISWLTTVYWRGGKPRTYLPGPTTGQIDNGTVVNTTVRGNLGTAANNFKTDADALTQGTITATQLGFLSFRSGNEERPSPIFYPYTGAIVHLRPGTQRRRIGRWGT